MNSSQVGILALALACVGLFSFASVFVWAYQRRREREAYYRSETLRRISETPGPPGSMLLDVIELDERHMARRRIEASRLGGLVTLAVGIGMMVFIKAVDAHDPEPAYLVGLIPTLVGGSLLFYVYVLAPRESRRSP